ncbi:diadenosine tetraphosphate (Ap4A) HIT family hydrolase [Priestia taiwanensis]|uniref:HIT family protein n=1 Tax=Priestia taiwanensis TaxID=1347902 RepID=A0A917EP00_9BACI|nr:diadenosine tetraphosphate (Ap4A) HIT family hydrolase [Priestia taiwanensis]GGE61118.1 HIT family protein [Priestia taiwanensis]
MNSCIFCEIISKREKAYIVYENEHVCCFLDKFPINKGHVLVVPKKHYVEFSELDAITLQEVALASQKIGIALEKLLDADGVTFMQNNGIFKDVDHYHMHIVSRFKDDGFSWVEPNFEMTERDFESLYLYVKNVL